MAERPLACEAWHPALAGWFVAQLSPEEEVALRAHLDTCAVCRTEADSLLDVAAVTLGADPGAPLVDEPPPADLGDRILARVARERRARRSGRFAVAMAGAAAAVASAVVLADGGDEPLRGRPVEFAHQATGVDASAVVAADRGGSVVELTASGLDAEVTYALWLTPPGGGYPDRIAAGTFRPDADGEVGVRLRSSMPAADIGRVWATDAQGVIALDTDRG
jgi:hypothetical protein